LTIIEIVTEKGKAVSFRRHMIRADGSGNDSPPE